MTRRDDREYREYLREEQRSQRGCIAGRMQLDFHHWLLGRSRDDSSPYFLSACMSGSPGGLTARFGLTIQNGGARCNTVMLGRSNEQLSPRLLARRG